MHIIDHAAMLPVVPYVQDVMTSNETPGARILQDARDALCRDISMQKPYAPWR